MSLREGGVEESSSVYASCPAARVTERGCEGIPLSSALQRQKEKQIAVGSRPVESSKTARATNRDSISKQTNRSPSPQHAQ